LYYTRFIVIALSFFFFFCIKILDVGELVKKIIVLQPDTFRGVHLVELNVL